MQSLSATIAAAMGAALLATGGAVMAQDRQIQPAPMQEWRTIARAGDEAQVDEWQTSLVTAVLAARENGEGDLYARDPALYSPDVMPDQRSLSAGDYSCASIQIDKGSAPGGGYYAYPPFRCRVTVEDGVRVFEKLTGSQRTRGVIYDAPDVMGDVYLGTANNDQTADYEPYGTSVGTSESAVIHSLGDGRFRMIFPGHLNGGSIEILEIRPL